MNINSNLFNFLCCQDRIFLMGGFFAHKVALLLLFFFSTGVGGG